MKAGWEWLTEAPEWWCEITAAAFIAGAKTFQATIGELHVMAAKWNDEVILVCASDSADLGPGIPESTHAPLSVVLAVLRAAEPAAVKDGGP